MMEFMMEVVMMVALVLASSMDWFSMFRLMSQVDVPMATTRIRAMMRLTRTARRRVMVITPS
jgi:hypothetical protein